jgi:hypothetical protein
MGRGDGRTFDQALRLLDRLVEENNRRLNPGGVPDPDSPIRLAYERIVSGRVVAPAA